MPEGVAFKEEVNEVATGDRIKISVRLPAMRRFRQKGVTKLIPIEFEDRDDYYSGILSRSGAEVDSIEWLPNPDSTIFFKSGSTMVTIPVDDVSAWVSVKDAELFAEVIVRGVGRYKTYGCGMKISKSLRKRLRTMDRFEYLALIEKVLSQKAVH